jgi:hypothetical protein
MLPAFPPLPQRPQPASAGSAAAPPAAALPAVVAAPYAASYPPLPYHRVTSGVPRHGSAASGTQSYAAKPHSDEAPAVQPPTAAAPLPLPHAPSAAAAASVLPAGPAAAARDATAGFAVATCAPGQWAPAPPLRPLRTALSPPRQPPQQPQPLQAQQQARPPLLRVTLGGRPGALRPSGLHLQHREQQEQQQQQQQ